MPPWLGFGDPGFPLIHKVTQLDAQAGAVVAQLHQVEATNGQLDIADVGLTTTESFSERRLDEASLLPQLTQQGCQL